MQIGPFTIERELGRGGMGAVYLGRTAPGAPPVAVKVIHASLNWDEGVEARFRLEGDALERLNHPNLVRLRGRGREPRGCWLAMDYVEGESLGASLKAQGAWAIDDARDLLLSLCAGIEHAHQEGVLHRDLKPENVLLRAPDAQPLIVDFGLARPLDVSQHLTATGEILGSPGYLAPEQCGAGGKPSRATDVYGLGAVLYTALTGEPPFRGATLIGTLDLVLNAAPRSPRSLVPNVPPGLEAICLRCLAKDPAQRFESAAALGEALRQDQARVSARAKRRPVMIIAGLLVLGGLGLGATFLPWDSALAPGGSPVVPGGSVEASPPASQPPVESGLWREGPFGAQHAALAGREDLEALQARRDLLVREANEIPFRGVAWIARRAHALAIASQASADSPAGASEWIQTMATDDFFAESLDDPSELIRCRERGRALIAAPGSAPRGLREGLARIELKTWRTLDSKERQKAAPAVISSWNALERDTDTWWREAVKAEVLMAGDPLEALKSLERVEARALSASAKAWAEFLRCAILRELKAHPREYLGLLRQVSEWPEASPTLRARAGLLLGVCLLEGSAPGARAVLDQVEPRALTRHSQVELQVGRAQAALRAGDLAQARALLRGSPAEAAGDLGSRLAAVRGELLLRAKRGPEAKLALAQGPPPGRRAQILDHLALRALLGQREVAQSSVDSLSADGSTGLFDAYEVLQRLKDDPGLRSGARADVEALRVRARNRLQEPRRLSQLLRELLDEGRWRSLIRAAETFWLERNPQQYASLVSHALVAAEEVDVSRQEVARATRAALVRLEAARPRSKEGEALLNSVLERQLPAGGDSEARRRRVAEVWLALDEVWRPQGEPWEAAAFELIRLLRWAERHFSEFEGLSGSIAKEWERRSAGSLDAFLTLADIAPTPARVAELAERCQEGSVTPSEFRALRVIYREARRGIRAINSPFPLSHESLGRLGLRRALLLEEVRRQLLKPGTESGEAALLILWRIQRWCPPVRDVTEFELLFARAFARVGKYELALKALKRARLGDLTREQGAEILMLEARALSLHGAPQKEFGAKLVASWAAGATSASCLDYARMLQAAGVPKESVRLYGKALGFPLSRARVASILSEIHEAGLDLEVALEVAVEDLTIRASALRAFSLLQLAAGVFGEESFVRLRMIALVRFSRERLDAGKPLPVGTIDNSSLIDEEQALTALLLRVHKTRRDARGGGLAPQETLQAVAAELEEFSQRLESKTRLAWDVDAEQGYLDLDLGHGRPTEEERTRFARSAERHLAQANLARPGSWRALDQGQILGSLLGERERALEVFAKARKRAERDKQRKGAARLARAEAIFLFELGRFSEAEAALEVAAAGGLPRGLRAQVYLQLSLARALAGKPIADAIRKAWVSGPEPGTTEVELDVVEVIHGELSHALGAARLARATRGLAAVPKSNRALMERMITVASASLLRRQGDLEGALEYCAAAMSGTGKIPPGAVDERLACHKALGPAGNAALVEWAKPTLDRPSLLPYEAARIKEALAAAEAD